MSAISAPIPPVRNPSNAAAPARRPSSPATRTAEMVYQLSVDQYHKMIDSGLLGEDDPVELVEGVLVHKMPKNTPHSSSTMLSSTAVMPLLPEGWHYRVEQPITLPDGEPEPDGSVARGGIRDYLNTHPQPKDLALVIEVADSSIERDRGMKLRSYARAGIMTFWIVNLVDHTLEVYTDPKPDLVVPAYASVSILDSTQDVPLVIAGTQVGTIPVSSLLP